MGGNDLTTVREAYHDDCSSWGRVAHDTRSANGERRNPRGLLPVTRVLGQSQGHPTDCKGDGAGINGLADRVDELRYL